MINSWFSSEKRRKNIRASKSRRRLRVEAFEQRMMLHGDAMDCHDTTTGMEEMSTAADMAAGSMSTLSAAAMGAQGEAIAEGEAIAVSSKAPVGRASKYASKSCERITAGFTSTVLSSLPSDSVAT